jgi:hypothetical protein
MDNIKSPSLIHYIVLNAAGAPRPWWDTLVAGGIYWSCFIMDFIAKSPLWGFGAKMATLFAIISYVYKFFRWLHKIVRDFKNRK